VDEGRKVRTGTRWPHRPAVMGPELLAVIARALVATGKRTI